MSSFLYYKLQLQPGQAGLCSGLGMYFFSSKKLYILHHTQIQTLDSNHIKIRHIEHKLKGIIHFIPKNNDIIITKPLIISHKVHAKRFCIAHTYSGFCFFTKYLPIFDKGEYLGHRKTFIRKSKKNNGTTILSRV
jgi:hypothetical protein